MANITVRKENGGTIARSEFEPFRWARDLLRWDPFREMMPNMPVMDAAAYLPTFVPAFEVKETKEGFVFKADLPGVAEKDLEITRTGNRLMVAGKREAEHEEKSDTYYACERSYGAFSRSFTLPDGIDGEHIRADLKDGVLTLIVPKTAEALPKKILVRPSERRS